MKPSPNAHRPAMYGSHIMHEPAANHQKGFFIHGQRRRLNIVAICISLFVPWLLFCIVYWAMSFSLHYKNPFLCYVVVLLGLCFVGFTAYLAFQAIRKKEAVSPLIGGNDTQREPTWLIFLFITCLIAWLLATLGGDANYINNLEPYYDVSNLNIYPSVDPSRMRGQQLMDAGRVMFTRAAKLDLTRAVGFKNSEMYCVAPIVSGDDPKHLPTYDFWAVGVNCCSGDSSDFHCGAFNNGQANAGLRLMRDDQRPFFRLAVQQAEAAYNIKADHPLFFHWMQDPVAEVNAYMEEGFKYYLLGIFTHFIFQCFLVAVACFAFAKLGALD